MCVPRAGCCSETTFAKIQGWEEARQKQRMQKREKNKSDNGRMLQKTPESQEDRLSLPKRSVRPRPNDIRDQRVCFPFPLSFWAQQMEKIHDAPRPAFDWSIPVVLACPPSTPHKVDVQKFQLAHNVRVWPADERVREAAVQATKDLLKAWSNDGLDGLVKVAPQGGRDRT